MAARHGRHLMVNPIDGESSYRIQVGDSLLFIADSEATVKHEVGDPRGWRRAFHCAE